MSKSQHTEVQMIGALKQLEAGRKAEDVAREVGVSKHTIYAWKAKYGGMDVSEAQEAKQMRDENTKLKKLVVDLSLDKEMLKAVIAKNGWSSTLSASSLVTLSFPAISAAFASTICFSPSDRTGPLSVTIPF